MQVVVIQQKVSCFRWLEYMYCTYHSRERNVIFNQVKDIKSVLSNYDR